MKKTTVVLTPDLFKEKDFTHKEIEKFSGFGEDKVREFINEYKSLNASRFSVRTESGKTHLYNYDTFHYVCERAFDESENKYLQGLVKQAVFLANHVSDYNYYKNRVTELEIVIRTLGI